LAQGTYRPDRDRSTDGNALPLPAPAKVWEPEERERLALGPRTQGWLAATIRLYSFDDVEGRQLMAAMLTQSRIEQLEDAIDAAGGATSAPRALLTELARAERTFQAQWASLRLEKV
jgi:hypothetical protein